MYFVGWLRLLQQVTTLSVLSANGIIKGLKICEGTTGGLWDCGRLEVSLQWTTVYCTGGPENLAKCQIKLN